MGLTSARCTSGSIHARRMPGVYSKYSRWSTSSTSTSRWAASVRAAVRPAKPPPRTATRVERGFRRESGSCGRARTVQ
eukprot:2213309-Prymnesium_polylepis.1